jgi:signal transduction histidine kinase
VLSRFALALLLAVGTLTAMVVTLVWQDRWHERVFVQQQCQNLINLQFELVTRELASLESDLLVLAEQETLQRFLIDPVGVRPTLEEEYVRFARVKGIYDQIRLLDQSGKELVRVNYGAHGAGAVPEGELQSKASRYYYRQALALSPGDVLVTPFDLNVEKGAIEEPLNPVIRLITPIHDPDGKQHGLLVLNYGGTRLLQKLADVSRGTRGVALLINGDGEYLLGPKPQHAWGWMLGHHHSFAAEHPTAWHEILETQHQPTVGNRQFTAANDLFTVRWLNPLPRAVAQKMNTREAMTTYGVNRSTLILVSHVPDRVAYASSDRMLERLSLVYGVATILVTGLAWYLVRASWLRRFHEQQIADSEHRLRRLSSQLLAAQEDERRSISRELHDELGQQVTAIRLDIHSAVKEPPGERREFLIRQAASEVDELLQSLHRIASRVRPFVLDDLGLQDAIESHVSEYERRTGIQVKTELAIPVRRITATIGDNVYRIVQEGLANVAKHAQVDQAEVLIYAESEQLHVEVRDHGVGFHSEARDTSRLGILGIQERAELLGGKFRLEATPGRGTTVMVTIPLYSPAEMSVV